MGVLKEAAFGAAGAVVGVGIHELFAGADVVPIETVDALIDVLKSYATPAIASWAVLRVAAFAGRDKGPGTGRKRSKEDSPSDQVTEEEVQSLIKHHDSKWFGAGGTRD